MSEPLRERLRKIVVYLNQFPEITDAVVEIERLTRERDELSTRLALEIDTKDALRGVNTFWGGKTECEREVDRLRAALENIIATESVDNDGEPVPETGACFLARRALQEPKP